MFEAVKERIHTPFLGLFSAGLGVGLAAFLAYANTLQNGFVWDDHLLIEGNAFVRDWSNAKKVVSPGYFFHYPPLEVENGARPVWVLSALLDCKWWGLNPAGHHLTSVSLHAVNSLLVFCLALLLGARLSSGRLPFAFLAGLLFALHPVHTEAVAVVGFRADLLCALFFLAALALYVLSRREEGEALSRPRRAARGFLLAASVAAAALAFLSKQMALTLPLVIVLHDFCFAEGGRFAALRRRLPVYGAYAALWPAYAVFHTLRFDYDMGHWAARWLERAVSWITLALPARAESLAAPTASMAAVLMDDPLGRLGLMLQVFAGHLRLLVWPHPLKAEYAVPLARLWEPAAFLGLLAAGGLLWTAWRGLRRTPALSFGVLAFLATLLPVSNLVLLYNPMAERYLYLPSAAFCLILAGGMVWGGSWAMERLSGKGAVLGARLALGAAGLSLFGGLTALTVQRNAQWRDEKAVWELTSRQSPSVARVWYNRGFLAQQEGESAMAERFYRTALVLRPDYVEARNNLAGLLAQKALTREAESGLRSLVASKPKVSLPYFNYAALLMKEERWDEAAAVYKDIEERFAGDVGARHRARFGQAKAYALAGEEALSEEAFNRVLGETEEWARTRFDLGRVFQGTGQWAKAERHYALAVKTRPDWADAWINLGFLYHRQGRLSEARDAFGRAVAANPRKAVAHHHLGVAFSNMSELAEAEKAFLEAVRLDPAYDDAHYNLAVVYQRQGRLWDAVRAYERVVEIRPRRVEALSNLGGCYLALGDLERAEAFCRRAIQADPSRSAPYVNLGALYQRKGDVDGAVSFYQEAIRRDPQDAMAYNNLGLCFLQKGELAKARQEFLSALRADPRLADAHFHLGLVFERQGLKDEAVAAWKAALQINPRHAGALKALGGR